VNKTFDYDELTVDVMTAAVRDGVLRLQTQVTNVLSSPQQFNPLFTVASAGESYEGRASTYPTIAGAGQVPGPVPVPVELDATVDARFTMSDAVLTFGNETKNQAVIPLGSAGAFVPLLDVEGPLPAPLTVGEQSFTFTGSSVSAYGYDGSELNAGTRELVLRMSVANADPAHGYTVDGTVMRFVSGSESLSSGAINNATLNPGGTARNVRFFADIDNYKAGASLTITIAGADAQQARISQTISLTLPALE
jgi:hypothetical protein